MASHVEGVTVVATFTGVSSFVPCIPGKTSDGYHTFDELYEHRCLLFMALLRLNGGWKSRVHHDGSAWDGWFIAGTWIDLQEVTYHLPERLWDLCPGTVLETAHKWDGHTSDDVLERLKSWLRQG